MSNKINDYQLLEDHKDYFRVKHNKDGAEFKVAKRDLGPEMHAKISKLVPKELHAADGVQVAPIQDEPVETDGPPETNAAPSGLPANVEQIQDDSADVGDDNQADVPDSNVPPQNVSADDLAKNVGNFVNSSPQVDTTPSLNSKESAVPQIPPSKQVSAPKATDQSAANKIPEGLNPIPAYEAAAKKEMEAKSAEAEALGQQGKKEAQARDQQMVDLTNAKNEYEGRLQGLNAQSDNLYNQIQNAKVDPQRLFNNANIGQKITAGISMLLGGLSGGLNKTGVNPGLNVINENINRDIDSQKSDLANKQNLYNQNLALTKNTQDAYALTQSQLQTAAAAQIAKVAAMSQDPLVKARAQGAIAQIQQQLAQTHQNMAVNQTLIGLSIDSNQDPTTTARKINILAGIAPDKAKPYQEHFVPGIGLANMAGPPVPNDVRESITAKQDFLQKLKTFREFAAAHSGTLPTSAQNLAIINRGAALGKDLSGGYRAATHGGVYKEGEAKFIDGIVPSDPTQFFTKYRVDPKLDAIGNNVQGELDNLKKNWGFTTPYKPQSATPYVGK